MTDKSSGDLEAAAGSDQKEYPFGYGHGRMPFFMKVVWVAFLAFCTWYIVQYLLTAVGKELAK